MASESRTAARRRWIATWSASPQAAWGADFAFPTNLPAMLAGRTIRQVVRISLGGARLRLVLSNACGDHPLRIASAHVALADVHPGGVVPGTGRRVTFDSREAVTIPPGAPMLSDPVDLDVPTGTRLAVSLYLHEEPGAVTFHWDARDTAFVAEGDHVAAGRLQVVETTTTRLFLTGIEVEAGPTASAVVTLGDSITDGNGATMGRDARWPDALATRLARQGVAVLNAGISGARLTGDRMGANALARLDRDVLGQAGVDTVIVLLGINDIAWPGTAFDPHAAPPDPDRLISAYRQLALRVHARGLRIVAGTLTPFEGALPDTPLDNYHDTAKDALRQRVNAWIRSGDAFDAVIDFDALLRDPAHPARLRATFDSGDHLHPGDAGNAAMAAAAERTLAAMDAARRTRKGPRSPPRTRPPRAPMPGS